MIMLNFNGVDQYQIDEWLSFIPKYWKRHRGAAFWGVGLKLKSVTERQIHQEHLVITDWKFTWMHGATSAIVFLFKPMEDSCEVFISWQEVYDKRLADTLKAAFECLKRP